MRFFLVRHGKTDANARGLLYGSTDLSLTAQGIEQSQRVAGYLSGVSFTRVITSQLQRAQQTAGLIVPDGTSLHREARLNEMDFGEWEMRHYHDIATAYPQDWQRRLDDWQNGTPVGGESFPHFAGRVRQMADELAQSRRQADTLIVAHQGVLSLLLTHWLGLPTEAMWHFPFMQDAWTMVEHRAGVKSLRVFNDRSSFRPE